MIVRYPTGLYSRQIPTSPSDVGNVTFTISNEEPSELPGDFILFPIAEQVKKRPPKVYTNQQRRVRLGDLIYTVTGGGVTSDGTNVKLFEVGQVLEFTDTEIGSTDTNIVPDRLELQHNTNLLDLESLGLSESDIISITTQSTSLEDLIEAELTTIQNSIADDKSAVTNLQKKINEANKVLSALNVMGGSEEIKAKIVKTLNDAMAEQATKIAETNDLIAQSAELRDKLLAVSQLVR